MILDNFCRPRQSVLDTFNIPKTRIVHGTSTSAGFPTITLGDEDIDGPFPVDIYLTGDLKFTQINLLKFEIVIEYFNGSKETFVVDGANMTIPAVSGDVKQITINNPVLGPQSLQNGSITFEARTIGIFEEIQKQLETPVAFLNDLDMEYFLNHSGSKAVANMVHMMTIQNGYNESDESFIKHIDYADRRKVAKAIITKFMDSWVKIYDAMETEYKPLENYSMFEKTEPNLTDTFGVSDDYEKKNERKTASKVTTEQEDVTTDGDVYGFNSASAVPATKNTANGTVTVSGLADDNVNTDIETQTGARVETHTGDSKVTRSGNIGVTTSQQMLQSEIDLRIKNHMEDIVFSDVDQILTTAGYAPVLSNKIHII